MVENDFRMFYGIFQVQFLRERRLNSTKVSTKRGASLGSRLRDTLTRRCFQLVSMKLPFYYCSICSARKLLSYFMEKLSQIIETHHCYDGKWSLLCRAYNLCISIYCIHNFYFLHVSLFYSLNLWSWQYLQHCWIYKTHLIYVD